MNLKTCTVFVGYVATTLLKFYRVLFFQPIAFELHRTLVLVYYWLRVQGNLVWYVLLY